ncbi:hypothetical protein Dimus_004056 [Dionaea muscipula]
MKLPKKLKPKKVKEAVVATSSISKSSPVKRTTPSQSRRSRSKTPLSPPRISSPEPIGAKDKQKAIADDVADDVVDTSVKAEVVKVADVAAKIVHTPAVADLDVLVDKIVMDIAGMDVPKQDDVVLNELHTPDRCQILNATDPGSIRFVRVVGEGRPDFNARSPSDKRYLSICSHYVGTLEYADAKFFATFTGDEAQPESMHIDAYLIYLAKRMMHRGSSEYAITKSYFFNWHRNFHEIPQHVVAYVSEIRPCVVRVLGSPIALGFGPHKFGELDHSDIRFVGAQNPKKSRSSVGQLRRHEATSSTDLRRGWIFQAKRQRKENRALQSNTDSTNESGQTRRWR